MVQNLWDKDKMIEILNKEWGQYKLVIFTTEEGILLDVKAIKTNFNKEELQRVVTDLYEDTCETCERKDEPMCTICKKLALEKILVTLEKDNIITNVENSIGLKVYKGIAI